MLSAGGAAVPAAANFQNKRHSNKHLAYLKLSMNLTVFLSNGTVVPPLYERIFESILIALTKALGRKYRNKSNARPFLSMILNKGFHIILSLGKIRRLRRMGVEYIRIRGVFLHLSSINNGKALTSRNRNLLAVDNITENFLQEGNTEAERQQETP